MLKKGVTRMADICLHCKHHKTKYLNGKLVSDYCNLGVWNHYYLLTCTYFKRSWKSRLGLVNEGDND